MPDPYDWLGIPPAHRPPTHYQLLGLPTSVKDPTEIKSAADRQLKRLQPHLTGPDGSAARILRAEISRARDTLLDPEQRAIYDALSPDVELVEEPPAAPEIDVELVAEPPPQESVAEEVADTPSETAAEEPVTPPDPWWKETSAAEAADNAAETQPWWKQ
ncbi:MAG TPA: DnaJ domain-containing protein, partial [Gemmataceae bacterium]|nr:DnaJ domain-containing protein [Gemmataceae bacterium]